VHVVDSLVEGDTPSTKSALAALRSVSERKHVLVVVDRDDRTTWLSLRNVPEVHLLDPGQLNTYDVLISDDVVFLKSAYDRFIAGPSKGKSAKATAGAEGDAATDAEGSDA
jgi:large subunit ribosomal protein L4